MDEILSSIRQIIADDDAAAAPRRPIPSESGPTAEVVPMLVGESSAAIAATPVEPDSEMLTLSPEQIVAGPAGEAEAETVDFSAFMEQAPDEQEDPGIESKAAFIDPEDIAFEPEAELAPAPKPAPLRAVVPPAPAAQPARQPERSRPATAEAAPMPDPRLSRDIAEELLEPTTNAAVRANLSRLTSIGIGTPGLTSMAIGTPGLTIEDVVRETLRPMLKEWLDEHLPAVVERMVEKEIARISRDLQ
ncbi:MAG: DUF2497 domain-containing protein [Devosia sp.]|nr:DUF2497 domain-containing protein [Devosia sp.]